MSSYRSLSMMYSPTPAWRPARVETLMGTPIFSSSFLSRLNFVRRPSSSP